MDWRKKSSKRGTPRRSESAPPPSSPPPADPGTGGGADWRGGKGRSKAGSTRPPITSTLAWSDEWKQSTKYHKGDRVLWFRLKLGAFVALILSLIAVLLIYVFWFPTKTPMLALAVTTYEEQLPPNAFALEDVERFNTLFDKNNNVAFQRVEETELPQLELTERVLEFVGSARPGGPRSGKGVILLYLSVHGLVNADGQPCLISSDADPQDTRDKTKWVPVEDLFGQISERTKSSGARTVVLLDCNRIHAAWESGVLYNDFVDRLSTVVRQLDDDRLVVINSTGPGQQARADLALGGSPFGYFTALALAGAADGNDDGKIYLGELVDYIAESVSEAVRGEAGVGQRPVVIPEQPPDFPLVWVTSTEMPEAEDSQAIIGRVEGAVDGISPLWDEHDQLAQTTPWVERPATWAELEFHLQRLDRLAMAGGAYESDVRDGQRHVRELIGRLREPVGDPGPFVALDRVDSSDLENGRSTLAAWREFKSKPDAPPEEMPKVAPMIAAATVWKTFQEGGHSRAEVAELLRFLADMGPPAEPEFPEVHLTRMLTQWVAGDDPYQFAPLSARAFAAGQLAATPPDRRAQYWVRPATDKADTIRRLADDHLLIGREQNLRRADRAWNELVNSGSTSSSYSNAIQVGTDVSRAYRLRDRAWAQWHHLARYTLGKARLGSFDDVAYRVLFELLDQMSHLGRVLDTPQVADADGTRELSKLADGVEQQLQRLMRAYRDHENRLFVNQADLEQSLREIDLFLDSPLTTGAVRNQLRMKYLRLSGSQSARGDEAPPSSRQELDQRYLTRMTSRHHPALEVLSPADLTDQVVKPEPLTATAERDQRLEILLQQGELVRQLLGGLREQANRLQLSFNDQFHSRQALEGVAARADLSLADRLSRARSPLAGNRVWADVPTDPTPTRRLREVDQFFQLSWHASRTLGDAWGPSPTGEPAYFERVASAYETTARQLASKATAYLAALRRQRESQSEVLSRAGSQDTGVRAVVDDQSVSPDARMSPQKAAISWDGLMEPGLAAFYVSDPQDATVPLQTGTEEIAAREAVRLDERLTEDLQFRFGHEAVNEADLQFQANTLFRFHRRSDTFLLRPSSGGDELVFAPPPFRAPRVMLQGSARKKSWIIFVLDCSGTMSLRDGTQQSRMRRATNALNQILARLENNAHDIGILCYGHRAGWTTRSPFSVRYSNPALRDSRIDPRIDVAWLNNIKRSNLDGDLRATLNGQLTALNAWGETPLYRAMHEGLSEFARWNDIPESRHLIVITDGVNNQTNPQRRVAELSWMEAQIPNAVSLEDVNRRHSDAQLASVSIDVLFLGSGNVKPKDQASFNRLRGFAQGGGRRWRPVSQADNLVAELTDALGVYEFYVKRQGAGDPPRDQWLKLGENWRTDWNGDGDGLFEVHVRGARNRIAAQTTLDLFGNEQIRLSLNGTRLVHSRYGAGDNPSLLNLRSNYRRLEELEEPGNGKQSFYIGIHRPFRENNGVRFPISIQNSNEQLVSQRPRQMWAEIVAKTVTGDRQLPPYVIYDLDFEADRPVPVVNLRIPNWPAGHQLAEVSLWLKTTPPRPTISYALEDALKRGEFQALEGDGVAQLRVQAEGGNTQSEGYRVIVTEKHRSKDTLRSLRIHMTPRPARWSHSFVEDVREVRHEFEYPDRFSVANPRIHVTQEGRVKNGALQTGVVEIRLPR